MDIRIGILLFFLFVACENPTPPERDYGNPPAPGFDLAGSDSMAIRLADQVMLAQGGRQAWDETRYLRWNFFNSRRWYWDKWTGAVRVENLRDSMTVLYNLQTEETRVWKEGQEWTEPDTLSKYGEKTRNAWINDSYWLFMPFKLKDTGLTILYVGSDTLPGGGAAEVLELRFQEVGVTPENKYRIWVDATDDLVKQWAFYAQASDSTARFTTPWEDYARYGTILLSASRGNDYRIREIAVFEEIDPALFQSLDPPYWPLEVD